MRGPHIRSHSGHGVIIRQIELITSWEYFLYAMFDDNRSNEELTWGGGIRDTRVRHDNIEELYQLCSILEEFTVRGSKTLKLYMDLFA